MIEKNQKYTVEITGIGEKGEGIGRIDNFAIFVPYALLGETAEVLIVKVLKNYAFGKIVNILKSSPNRLNPECPVFYKCGGCDFQHCTYKEELSYKTKRVKDCIERIGGLNVKVEDTVGCSKLNYRNKSQFPVSNEGIGFYAPRSHRVVPINNCIIQNESSNRVIEIVGEYVKNFHIKPYDERTGKGVIRHVFTRCALTGQIMVCIVTASESLKNAESLVSMLKSEFGDSISVIQNINTKNTNVILGDKNVILNGNSVITDKIGDLYFEISPQSFFQINPYQTNVLYDKVLELAQFEGTERVLDLYCGIGTISLYVARSVEFVTGVECVPQAVENAKKNATLNNIKNAEFYVGNAEDIAEKFPDNDVLILDPPRKGCDIKLLNTISKILPERIIYVSCNPATLARDLKILHSFGYEIKKITPIDMFPRTSHVETVCLLSKLKSSEHIDVELSMDELDLTAAEKKATYQEIKDYVLEHHGLKVSQLNIAQVKRKYGIIERENYNRPKSDDSKQPGCTKEKEDAITEALKHFGMI